MCVLEAMKMQNSLIANMSGKVSPSNVTAAQNNQRSYRCTTNCPLYCIINTFQDDIYGLSGTTGVLYITNNIILEMWL